MDHSWSSGKNFFEGCVGLRGPSERHLSEGETGEWRGYLTVVLDELPGVVSEPVQEVQATALTFL